MVKNSKMKGTISEMKNTLEGINSRLDQTEDQISDLGDKVSENTQLEQQHEKRIRKSGDSVSDLWENMKHNNIHNIEVPEGEERKSLE